MFSQMSSPDTEGSRNGWAAHDHMDTRGKESEMGHTLLRTPLISDVHAQKRVHSADKVLTCVPFFGILTPPIRCISPKEIAE